MIAGFIEFVMEKRESIFSNEMGDCSRFWDQWKPGRPSKRALARRKMYHKCESKLKIKYIARVLEK